VRIKIETSVQRLHFDEVYACFQGSTVVDGVEISWRHFVPVEFATFDWLSFWTHIYYVCRKLESAAT